MLEAKTWAEIEAILGMEGGALKAAIESDDSKDITIPTGQFVDNATHQVFTNKELLQREDKLKETHENAGREMLIKEYKREKGLEFEGKTVDHLLKFSNEAAVKEAGIAPDEKNKLLQEKNEKLVGMNNEWETKYSGLEASNLLAESKRGTDNDILGFMTGDYSVGKSDLLTIFNSKHAITNDADGRVIKRGGEVLQDAKTLSNLGLESVVGDFVKDYAKMPTGGGGGGDNGGGSGGGSLDVFRKQKEDAGMTYGSDEYMRAEANAIKDGTLVLT
jgi:hypothetical protein